MSRVQAVLFLAILGFARQLHAGCSVDPTVGVRLIPGPTGVQTIAVDYNFIDTSPSQRVLYLYLNDASWPNYYKKLEHPPNASDTWYPATTSCWSTGEYVIRAKAESCAGTSDFKFKNGFANASVDTQTEVSATYEGPDAEGTGTLHVTYKFPNTLSKADREILVYVDNASWPNYYKLLQPDDHENTIPIALNVTCWTTGSHPIRVVAAACKNPAEQSDWYGAIEVDSTPTLDVSFTGPDQDGKGTLLIGYEFPNTLSADHRDVAVYLDNASWPNTYALKTFSEKQTDSWPIPVDTSCMPSGPHSFRVFARACGTLEHPSFEKTEYASFTVANDPSASVKEVVKGADGKSRAIVTYNFPQTPQSQRHLKLEWLPSHTVIDVEQPDQNSGEWPVELPACPANGDKLIQVTATACGSRQHVSKPVSVPECEKSCSLECPTCVGKPIRITNGNMRLDDSDALPAGAAGSLRRTYNSRNAAGVFGKGWTSIFDARAVIRGGADNRETVYLLTDDAEDYFFVREPSGTYTQRYPAGQRFPTTLIYDAGRSAFLHRNTPDGLIRIYSASNGRLIAYRRAQDVDETTITYDANGRPITVQDPHAAWSWSVATNANGRVATITIDTVPSFTWTYNYDSQGNLLTVINTAGTWRTYTYGASGLTEARDGAGRLMEGHQYDAAGNAVTSTQSSDDITAIEYDLPGRVAGETVTRVTSAGNRQTLYYSRYIAGKMRTVEIDGSCDCGSEDVVYAYDDEGHIVREQDARGYITIRIFSNDRLLEESMALRPLSCDPATQPAGCRLTPDTLHTALLTDTSATTTRSFTYSSAAWPEKPTIIRTTSIVKTTEFRDETFTYDGSTGQVLLHTITGWTGNPAVQQSRTTATSLYDGVEPALFAPGGNFSPDWLTLPQPKGMKKATDGPRSDVTDAVAYVYYPVSATVPKSLRGHLAAVRNPAGHITRYEGYNLFGSATRIVDPNGVATELSFDSLGRVTSTTTKGVTGCDTTADPLCNTDLTTTTVYEGATRYVISAARAGGGVTAYTYDDRGRTLTVSRGPATTDLRERVEYTYDAGSGNKLSERFLGNTSGAWVEKRSESFGYDANGRLTQVVHADGTSTTYTYAAAGLLGSVRDETHTAANTWYSYEAAGRITSVTQTLAGAPGGKISTQYTYDVVGNLRTVTDPNGNVTTYVYDDFGQLLQQQSPVSGVTTYAYDSGGNLTSTADANGATTTRTYDALGRVLTSASTRGTATESVSWSYDSTASGAFGIGRLASMTDPDGSVTAYAYERRGLLRQEQRTFAAGPVYTTKHQYDADANRSAIVYPSGKTATYTFDHAGRPATLSRNSAAVITSAKYLPFGPLSELVFGNGTTQTMSFDTRYLPLENKLTRTSGTTIAEYDYQRDAAGNITQITDALDAGFNRSFGYDDLNRLTTANSGASLWGTGSFRYDAMGTLLESTLGPRSYVAQTDGTTPKLSLVSEDGAPRYISYDAAGNEVAVGSESFQYNPRNQLSGSGLVSYQYDGRGIRSKTTLADSTCPVSVTGAPRSYPAAGGTGWISIAAEGSCTWTATSSESWLTLGSTAGAGGALLTYSIQPTTGFAPRTATITVGGKDIKVTQFGAAAAGNAAFDFSGSGRSDIVSRHSRTGDVEVRSTDGLTVSEAATHLGVAAAWKMVGSGDFDGDGKSELLWRRSYDGGVAMWFMNGNAFYTPARPYNDPDLSWHIAAIADLNGDGRADIVTRHEATGEVYERLMNRDSIIAQRKLFTEPDLDWRIVAAADFDGDGLGDLLWRNRVSGQVQTQRRDGGKFASRVTVYTEVNPSWFIAGTGDIDGDGRADVLMHNRTTGALSLYFRNGAALATPVEISRQSDTSWYPAQLGDYNGDGRADVLWRHRRNGTLRTELLSDTTVVATGSLMASADAAMRIPNAARAAAVQAGADPDTTADAHSDIFWRHSTTNDVAVWQMRGATREANDTIVNVPDTRWSIRAAGDFNEDGNSDLVWAHSQGGEVAVWFLKGSQLLTAEYITALTGDELNYKIEGSGDFDGDGNTDLVLRHATSGSVRFWELDHPANGQGWNVTISEVAVTDLNWKIAGLGDFDGDGRTDLLWWQQAASYVAVWLMDGGGTFRSVAVSSIAPVWIPQRVTDVTGDGRADVLLKNTSTGQIAWWEMTGGTIVAAQVTAPPMNDPGYVMQPVRGDYNSDEYGDLLFRHSNGNLLSWWSKGMSAPTEVPLLSLSGDQGWIAQRIEPQVTGTGGTSTATVATDSRASMVIGHASGDNDRPPSSIVHPPKKTKFPKMHGPPWWAPARSPNGPVPGPPSGPPPGGSSGVATTSLTSMTEDEESPSFEVAGTSETPPSAVPKARYSLYSPELQLLAETDYSTSATPSIAHEYLWFAGRPVAQVAVAATDVISYTFADHLGTPLIQTNSAAEVVWQAEYEPYGRVHKYRTGAARYQPLRFPGQEQESVAPERAYNIFRWYRGGWGRYTQADPLDRWPYISRDERHTKTFHPYAYADGSPVGLVDALGLDTSPGGPLKKDCWGKCVELYDKEMFLCETFKVNDEKNCAVGLASCVAKMILAPLWAPDCKKKYEICKSNLGSRWDQCIFKASIIYQNCLYENKCCQ